MTTSSELSALLIWLEQQASTIRTIEQEARDIVEGSKDAAAYTALMHKKAHVIAALADDAAPLLGTIAPQTKEAIATDLGRFSYGASKALELDSVFYMSALLYPDEHKPGEPNNLEKLIKQYQ